MTNMTQVPVGLSVYALPRYFFWNHLSGFQRNFLAHT